MNKSSCCSTSLPAFGVVSVLDFGNSNGCVVKSHCCFNLRFSDDIRCKAFFHILIFHLYIFFGEVSAKVFGPLCNRVVCFFIVEFSKFFVYFG